MATSNKLRRIATTLFGSRKSDSWQQNFDSVLGSNASISDPTTALIDLPIRNLQAYTDSYLLRKGTVTLLEMDIILANLIRTRAGHHKLIALTACGHAMSPQALRLLLTSDFAIRASTPSDFGDFAGAVLGARMVNPAAITKDEERAARALVTWLNMPPEEGLHNLSTLITACTLPNAQLVRSHLSITLREAFVKLSDHLHSMSIQSFWLSAYVFAKQLEPLYHQLLDLNQFGLYDMLDETIPQWQAWMQWKPSLDRLLMWRAFSQVQRKTLEVLLALEGPDFIQSRNSTLRESLSDGLADSGQVFALTDGIEVLLQPGESAAALLDRTLELVDKACKDDTNDTPHLTDLLGRVLLKHPIDSHRLQVAETLFILDDPSITDSILQLLGAEKDPLELELRTLLPLLAGLAPDDARPLQDSLGPAVAEQLSRCLRHKQDKLQQVISTNYEWTAVARELQAFGSSLRTTRWLHQYLKDSMRQYIDAWPSVEELDTLASIRQLGVELRLDNLSTTIDHRCLALLCKHGGSENLWAPSLQLITELWQQTLNHDCRKLMLLTAATHYDVGVAVQRRCLYQIPNLSQGFKDLLDRVLAPSTPAADADAVDIAHISVHFTRMLAEESPQEVVDCWRPFLRLMIEGQGDVLIYKSLNMLSSSRWLSWIGELTAVFTNGLDSGNEECPADSSSMLLRPQLQIWAQHLSFKYSGPLRALERTLSSDTMRYILLGGDKLFNRQVSLMMRLIDSNLEGPRCSLLLSAMACLSLDGSNVHEISQFMSEVALATEQGIEACDSVFDFHQGAGRETTIALVVSWLKLECLTSQDVRIIRRFATLLGLTPTHDHTCKVNSADERAQAIVPGSYPAVHLDCHLQTIEEHFQQTIKELLEEAQRLDALRLALKSYHADGVHNVLVALDIEDSSNARDAVAMAPANLVDVVECISDQEIELHFPLTKLTALQQIAMGIGTAQSLLVRLVLGNESLPNGFCIHLDADISSHARDESPTHFHWFMFNGSVAPNSDYCETHPSRLTYQMSRILYRYFESHTGFVSLSDVYDTIATALLTLASNCIVCGFQVSSTGTLHRSVICSTQQCAQDMGRAPIEVRCSDVHHDPAAVDLLVTAVYNSATTGAMTWLPGCPVTVSTEVTRMLNVLPSTVRMQSCHDPAASLRSLGTFPTSMDALLTWILSSYRGFLVSATKSPFKIPSMPGIHQFLLANSAPALESGFSHHLYKNTNTKKPTTQLLFHGTTLDRLYSILTQGLRVLSGTPQQAHGATYGAGIYLAREPSTSYGYMTSRATTIFNMPPNSAFGNANLGVLLACEYAGTDDTNVLGRGFHVVNDPSTVLVRYVFLVPVGGRLPLRAHVETPLMSVFDILRSRQGAVKSSGMRAGTVRR